MEYYFNCCYQADLELARERVERLEREKNEFKSLCDQLQLQVFIDIVVFFICFCGNYCHHYCKQLSEVCVEAQEHGQSGWSAVKID